MEAHRPRGPEEEISLSAAEQQEVIAESEAEKSQALSIAESELAAKALERQPVIVADRVSKAAETDEPIEKRYETRHEVKDEQSAQQPVSVGSILAKIPRPAQSDATQQIQTSSPAPQPVSDMQAKDIEESSGNPTIYRQAIRGGFIAAIIVIFIFILMLILT